MLIQGNNYIFKQDRESYQIRKGICVISGKEGWYFTKTYDNQIKSLLYTEEQMQEILKDSFDVTMK